MSLSATSFSSNLTADELFHVAVLDVKEGRHEEALSRLKRLLELGRDTAAVRTLLGAEYAELSMFESAQAEFEKAIALEPRLPIAHFQLGLTFYVRGMMDLAKQRWAVLETLNDQLSIVYYARALINFNDRQLDLAIAAIQTALSLNPDAALARDIRTLEKTILGTRESEAISAPKVTTTAPTVHALLTRYEFDPDVPTKPKKPRKLN